MRRTCEQLMKPPGDVWEDSCCGKPAVDVAILADGELYLCAEHYDDYVETRKQQITKHTVEPGDVDVL